MIKLVQLNSSPATDYDAIRKAKRVHRLTLLALRPKVMNQYADFAFCCPEHLEVKPLSVSATERAALHHCYDVETVPLDKIKSNIKAKQTSIGESLCQYCGISPPKGFDHYLPKSAFPEFSVLHMNLVPCCAECNEQKGDRFRDKTGRLFVSLFHDQFDFSLRWLHAVCTVKKGLPSLDFELHQPTGMTSGHFAVIQNHYRELRLLERYAASSSVLISEAASQKKATLAYAPAAALVPILRAQAAEDMKVFGTNYYKAVGLDALAQCPACLDAL